MEVGSNVTAVTATKDSGANRVNRNSLTRRENRFVVHSDSGMVTLIAALDREAIAEYQV